MPPGVWRQCVLGALALSGCSLTGLSDFAIYQCATHADCAQLNQRREIDEDACVRYQCAADSRCRLQPIDLDRDGHATIECAGSEGCGGDLPCDDCDDASAASFPGLEEVCDGIDNDCNLVVDDVGAAGTAAASTTMVSGTGTIAWHSYGAPLAGSGVAPVAFGGSAASFFNVAERDTAEVQALGAASANVMDLGAPDITTGCPSDRVRIPAPLTPVGAGGPCTSHEDCSDGVLCNGFELCDPASASADPTTGCVIGTTERACNAPEQCNERLGVCDFGGLGISASCPYAQVATAELGAGTWFAAAVQQTGCGNLVRVGYFTEGATDMRSDPGRRVLFRGDHHRSTSFRGVDPLTTDTGTCTGRSRAQGEPLGARSAAIAALPADPARGRLRPQALAGWLVSSTPGPQSVELLGMWQEQFTTMGAPVFWVNASGDAVPERLDEDAAGDAAPSITAWIGASTAGYLAAYGVAGGGIAIRFVPAFADPPEVQAVAPHNTPIFPGATERRTTAPLADLGTATTLATSAEASSVLLALGRIDGDRAVLGLAWREPGGVRFSTVRFDASNATFTGFAPEVVASDVADELALAYASNGVVLPGFERGGMMADARSSGGWLLAWRAGASAFGARFAELDGQRIAPATMRLGGELRRLHVYVGRTTDASGAARDLPRVLYHDAPAGELRAVGAFCGPPG